MADFPALSLCEVADRIAAPASRVNILVHARPDGDALGSATALSLYLSAMGRQVSILCADPFPKRLSFLFEGVTLYEAQDEADLTLAVDVASPTQLGALAERFSGRVELMLDHHEVGLPFAPHYIRAEAAASGEIVYELLLELAKRGGPVITTEMAARIYAAIASDTGGFRYANTTPATHRIAAELLGYGIRADRINHALFTVKAPELMQAERIALSLLREEAEGRISYVAIPITAREGLADEFFETAVDVARARAGCEIALSLRERAPGEFRVSLRSVDADVAAVAALFGGGGHLRAAGCTVKAANADEAFAKLRPALLRALSLQK